MFPERLAALKLVEVELVIVALVAVNSLAEIFNSLAKFDQRLVLVELVVVPLVATRFVVVKFVKIAEIAESKLE